MSDPSTSINPVIAIWKILKAAGVPDEAFDHENILKAAARCEELVDTPSPDDPTEPHS